VVNFYMERDNGIASATGLLESIIGDLSRIMDDGGFVGRHRQGAKSFMRKRVFSFRVLVCFLMTNLQKGLQREIALFCEAILSSGGSLPEVDKSAFCKARRKLKHSAFVELSDVVVQRFYGSAAPRQWKGFRLLGVDGSTLQLPRSPEIQQHFGVYQRRGDGRAVCLGRSLLLYDTINHLTLQAMLGPMKDSEATMLWNCLPDLSLQPNDLLIFDRYYASHLLFFYLQHRGVQFCFRMKTSWWKVVTDFCASGRSSALITLELPAEDRPGAAVLGISQSQLRVRLVRVELGNAEVEVLLTSLLDEARYSVADLKDLYYWRWPVEEAYKVFKHRVCVENFSGKTLESVLQDFHVKLFIMNLTAAAVQPLNEALKKPSVKVKHHRQINLTEALFSLKKAVVAFFVTNEVTKALKTFLNRIARITEPIRKNRKNKRYRLPKRKHYMTYKPL